MSLFNSIGNNFCSTGDVLRCNFNPQVRTHRWRTRKQKKEDRPSSSHLSTRLVTIQTKKNRAMTIEAEKSTLPQVELFSRRSPLDQFSPSTKQRTAVLAEKISCHNCSQIGAADRVPPVISHKRRKTLNTSACPEKFPSIPGNHSTSNGSSKTRRRVLFLWSTRKLFRKEGQGTPTENTQNDGASGNRCEVLSHLLRKMNLNVKSTSELKELHKM